MAKAPRTKRISEKAHQANIADKKSRKHKGHAPGSRHSEPADKSTSQNHNAKADPRLGSKKPVQLQVSETKHKTQQKFFSPAKELAAIEQDSRLEDLLDKIEQEQSLSAEDQQYVDQKLARHRQLCELLDIDSTSEGNSDPKPQHRRNPDNEEDALLDKFMNSDIKDHK
ncbi:Der GTPase-activating protein YihI [Lacimicrobium alkaliphilum]|uniref:Der GTPase-activating protein YihI n=1 Tax=Lacimicrobium alkaliphilum TaxID=1526571 RepID=A0ABQ1RIU7_9ALTE|nr:Der GTPase-activating protein YihI [Lacimicrobium alkaliphilum]GGD71949.1 Der GTPase-activating protein YihI [Lacimicrobium alkaliphilum]